MREKGKIRIWPLYFDSTVSRGKGRKVSRNLSIRSPNLEEIVEASEEMNLNPITENEAYHPKNPWKKTGFVLVDEKMKKTRVLVEIARIVKEKRIT